MSEQSDLLAIILRIGGNPADLPFWQACRSGRFLLHRCGVCQRRYWPASRCVEHGDTDMAWVESSGRGTLHTYTIMHRALTPAMRDKVPYVVGVIKLSEGPFFHSNLVDCPTGDVSIGMTLKAVMTRHDSGLDLPVFIPVPDG